MMRVFVVVVLAAVSFALSWECKQKNVRTYLEKKMINVCTNLEAGEQDELDQIYGYSYVGFCFHQKRLQSGTAFSRKSK